MARVTIAAIALLDLAVVLFLAGSWQAAAMFVAFVAFIVVPASMIAPLPIAIVAAVPWFFLRKAIGVPLAVDVVTAALLIAFAWRRRAMPRVTIPLVTFVAVPILFAIVWLGWHVPLGNEVRFYGLFGIDFGNLVSVISALRDSPMLPLSFVAGGGPLSYHWLYFTIPAWLADFGGGAMPNANALVLVNLLVAMLFVEAVGRKAAIVIFAPFTTYFYQALDARVPLGPLAVPERNHLLLSPLNSMITFGNNTVALVLAIAAFAALERWNAEGRRRDLVAGCLALAAIIGYSITLVFPLAIALFVWTLLGRVRRGGFALRVAAVCGFGALVIFSVLHVIGGDSTRHLAVAFDRFAFLKMVIFGMVPLWFLAARRRERTIHHVLIGACFVVPTMLYIAGGPTGGSDFSMKIATLMAIAFAPLIDVRRSLLAMLVIAAGAIQTSAYVLQFPYYRLRHVTTNGVAVPRDYAAALEWIRDHTPRSAIVIDPHELDNRDEIFTLILGERRVWLPTAYAKQVLINALPPAVLQRDAMSPEADVLLTENPVVSPAWRLVHREGSWLVFTTSRR